MKPWTTMVALGSTMHNVVPLFTATPGGVWTEPPEQLVELVELAVPVPMLRNGSVKEPLSADSLTAREWPSGVLAQAIHSQLVMMNTFPGGTTNGAVVPSGFCTVSTAKPNKLGHPCCLLAVTVRRSLALFGASAAAPERATNVGESSRATTTATTRDIRAILHGWGSGLFSSGSTATCTA